MSYSVRFEAKDGTVLTGEVTAEEEVLLCIFAVWIVTLAGAKEWNLFWVPRDRCVRL